jgi:hypothetical protein
MYKQAHSCLHKKREHSFVIYLSNRTLDQIVDAASRLYEEQYDLQESNPESSGSQQFVLTTDASHGSGQHLQMVQVWFSPGCPALKAHGGVLWL